MNKTDPIDRSVTTQTGVVWIDYGGSQHLAVVLLENSSISRGSKISFITFVHQDLKDKAIARATPNQPDAAEAVRYGCAGSAGGVGSQEINDQNLVVNPMRNVGGTGRDIGIAISEVQEGVYLDPDTKLMWTVRDNGPGSILDHR